VTFWEMRQVTLFLNQTLHLTHLHLNLQRNRQISLIFSETYRYSILILSCPTWAVVVGRQPKQDKTKHKTQYRNPRLTSKPTTKEVIHLLALPRQPYTSLKRVCT
jgi:hypothetical protein